MIYIITIKQTTTYGHYHEEYSIENNFKDVDSIKHDRIILTNDIKELIKDRYYTLYPYDTIIVNDEATDSSYNIDKSRYDKLNELITDYKIELRNNKINDILK